MGAEGEAMGLHEPRQRLVVAIRRDASHGSRLGR